MMDAVRDQAENARREARLGAGPSPVRWVAAGVMLSEALTFLIAASLHRGFQIPLGIVTLAEPMIGPASIVETTCGLALGIAAVTVLSGSRWGWLTAVVAHLISAGGVVLGIVALNAGRGPRTASNDAYHLTILTALAIGLVLLATPPVRAALARRAR
jgi:hypothetical protein